MIKWGYKNNKPETDEKKAAAKRELAVKRREEAERRRLAAQNKAKAEAAAEVTTRRGSTFLPDGGDSLDEKTLLAKAKEIVAVRGKRGPERQEQLSNLSQLASVSLRRNMYQTYLEILNYLITLQLDVTHMAAGGILPVPAWQKVYQDLFSLFSLVMTNKDLTLSFSQDLSSQNDVIDDKAMENDGDQLLSSAEALDATAVTLSFIERLDECLSRAFQLTDAHSKEYRERMCQSIDFCALLWVVWAYYNQQQQQSQQSPSTSCSPEVCRVAARLAQHLYFLPDRLSEPRWRVIAERIPQEIRSSCLTKDYALPLTIKPSTLVHKLCSCGSKTTAAAAARIRFRMAMYSIYNLALHDRFYEARDALQAGNYYDHALSHNVPEQVLYNRCLSQVGLAAFRLGFIPLTATILSEVCGASKQRELLAQGVAIVKGFEKTPEQEKAERRRLLPAHLHINLDVLENAYNM